MTSSGKQPGVAFWATVVVVCLLVAYPVSYGPVMWLYGKEFVPESLDDAFGILYYPMYLAMDSRSSPVWLRHSVDSYTGFWMGL
jgi:hypothetical protein